MGIDLIGKWRFLRLIFNYGFGEFVLGVKHGLAVAKVQPHPGLEVLLCLLSVGCTHGYCC